MELKDLRALAKRANRKIKVSTMYIYTLDDYRKSIEIIPRFPNIFPDEDFRVNYIETLSEAEKELFFLDIDKIEKELNIK